MKGNLKQAVVGFVCALALLAQAAVSWGVALTTEAQVDFMPKFDLNGAPLTTPTFTSTLGVIFGDFQTGVSGTITDNGVVAATGSATSAGSFITGVDGSVGS